MEGREQEVPHRQAHQGGEGPAYPGEDSPVGRLNGQLAVDVLMTCTRKVSSVKSYDAEQEKVLIFMPLMKSFLLPHFTFLLVLVSRFMDDILSCFAFVYFSELIGRPQGFFFVLFQIFHELL